jgi:hypothetical protein
VKFFENFPRRPGFLRSTLYISRSKVGAKEFARMDDGGLHLVKLCVGADGVEDLASWQAQRMRLAEAEGRPATPRHVTRMWPRRAPEILRGGSLYWVFKGMVRAGR